MTNIIKKTKILITLFLMLVCTSALVACSGDETPETTTAPKETTTEKITTTEVETTTEEPTTEYKYKGEMLVIYSSKKEILEEVVVEKGYKFYINDLVDEECEIDPDGCRGTVAKFIAIALYEDNYADKLDEFYNTYSEPGLDHIYITREQNAVIEYEGDEKVLFHLVEVKNVEGCGEYAYFDVYPIE